MDTKKTILVSFLTTIATMFIVMVCMHICKSNCGQSKCNKGATQCSSSYNHGNGHGKCAVYSRCEKKAKCSKGKSCSAEKSCSAKSKCSKGANSKCCPKSCSKTACKSGDVKTCKYKDAAEKESNVDAVEE